MKRWFWAVCLLLGLPLAVLLLWAQVQPWISMLSMAGSDRALQQKLAVSDPSVVYVLGKERWTEFNIPNGTPSLRVVVNATLASNARLERAMRWPYTLRYEFLDKNGKLLLQRDHSYRASLRQFQDKAGNTFSSSFYLEPGLMPTDGHVAVFNLAPLAQATRMRVRLGLADPAIRDVAFRLYKIEQVPDFRLAHRWLRLNDEQKAKLAQGNVYPHELLTESEIRNLLRHQEHPLGPVGIAGSWYNSRALYVMRGYEGEPIAEPVLPYGLVIDEQRHGVIPLPEQGGRVRLRFAALGAGNAPPPAPGSAIEVRWYGRLLAERKQLKLAWKGDATELIADWKGGLLEVMAQGGLSVRAFQIAGDGKEQEITPEAMQLQAFIAQKDAPLEFSIDHAGADPTPFRLDIRQSLEPGKAAAGQLQLGYQLLDPQGGIVREGSILAAPPWSRYDRLHPDAPGRRLTDAATYFFSLPVGVSAIRLSSRQPVLITGYSRPWDLVHETRVPEDSYMAGDGMQRQLSWFTLKPKHHHALVLGGRAAWLASQYRPPQDDPDLLAGRYQWQDFHPQGAWLGRSVFDRLEAQGPPHEAALPVIYRPIPLGQDLALMLQATRGVESVAASMAYFRKSSGAFEVRVFLDDRLFYQGRFAGTDGEIALPALSAGKHRVRVESAAGTAFYLNHTSPVAGSLQKRLVNRFDGKQLDFIYEHGAGPNQTLGMRLYTPQGQTGRTVLHVRLAAPRTEIVGPLQSWSFINRRFDVRPDLSSNSRLGAHGNARADGGRAFFIPLAQDLPAGKYVLHARLESGPGNHFLLSRITPGLAPERKMLFEQELRNVEIHE